jgi:hypothetical protein
MLRISLRKKRCGTRKGYILLETLVAVLILSFGIIYISRAFISPLRASKTCLLYGRAAEIARSKIGELRIGPIEKGTSSGEIQDSDVLYKWYVEVADENESLTLVTAKVCWKQGESESLYEAALPVFIAEDTVSEEEDDDTLMDSVSSVSEKEDYDTSQQ